MNMWTDAEGRIWFRALASIIVLTILGVWVYICVLTKTYNSLEWANIGLIVGVLGIAAVPSIAPPKTTP
jgi:hypothetical protein